MKKKKKVICKLQEIVDKKGTNLNKLSRLADISYPTIRNMANNKSSSVDFDVMAKICNVLEIDISELFKLESDIVEKKVA